MSGQEENGHYLVERLSCAAAAASCFASGSERARRDSGAPLNSTLSHVTRWPNFPFHLLISV